MARALARLQGGELVLKTDTPGRVTFVLSLPVAGPEAVSSAPAPVKAAT